MENWWVSVCVEPGDQGETVNKTGAPWPHQAVTKGIERKAWGVPEGGLIAQGRRGAGMEAAETEMGQSQRGQISGVC